MAKTLGSIFGIVFILVGILGFVPNPLIGDGAYFHADFVHNIVHLMLGIVLLIGAASGTQGTRTIVVVGILYLFLAVVGFFQLDPKETGKLLGLAEANSADTWLHAVLALGLLGSSIVAKNNS